MRIGEFEFQDRNGNEIEPTKNQLVVYIKSLHKQIAELKKQLAESESKRKSLEEKIKFLTEETEENFVDGQKYNQLKYQHVEKEDGLDKTIKFNTSNLDGSEFD